MCKQDVLRFGCGCDVNQGSKDECGKEDCTGTVPNVVAYSTGNCYNCTTSHVSCFKLEHRIYTSLLSSGNFSQHILWGLKTMPPTTWLNDISEYLKLSWEVEELEE
jgi:hypothetical protein